MKKPASQEQKSTIKSRKSKIPSLFLILALALSLPSLLATTGGVPAGDPLELTVYNGSGDGEYSPGEEVSISATPPAGYAFLMWIKTKGKGGHIQTFDSTTTFVMGSQSATVVAVFAKIEASFSPGPFFQYDGKGLFLPQDPNAQQQHRFEHKVRVTINRGEGASEVSPEEVWKYLSVQPGWFPTYECLNIWHSNELLRYFTQQQNGKEIFKDQAIDKALFSGGGDVYEASLWYEGKWTLAQLASKLDANGEPLLPKADAGFKLKVNKNNFTKVMTSTSGTLYPVQIVPDDNVAGVVGDIVPSNQGPTGEKHFVSPKKSANINDDYVNLKAKELPADLFQNLLEWDGGEAVANEPLKRRVKRDTTGKTVVKVKIKNTVHEADKMNVWVVWSIASVKNGAAMFSQNINDSTYAILNSGNTGWRFVFQIQPSSIITDSDRPALDGPRQKDVPGKGKSYFVNPANGDGDSAERKWDISRQASVTIHNPNLIPKADLATYNPAALIQNQPVAFDNPIPFPQNPVEGNDDPILLLGADENDDPYQASNIPGLSHQQGEIASFDAPGWAVLNSWGANNRNYALKANFREFARLEIWDGKRNNGAFWFKISDDVYWHHALVSTFKVPPSNWQDTGCSSNIGQINP